MPNWKAQPTRHLDGFGNEATRVALAGGSQLDAFGRLRVSNPALTLFDSQQHYNEQPLLWYTKTAGTGAISHDPDEAGTWLNVSANNDSVIRQSKQYHRYQPGKSQAIKATGTMSGTDGTMYVVQRSKVSGSVVEQRVAQEDWNFDIFDGNGVSGVTLNQDKSQIFVIDIEWLAVGQVRMGMVSHGLVAMCHAFENENTNPGAYMVTANLPVRYEIKIENNILYQRVGYFDDDNGVFFEKQSAYVSGTKSLLQICCAVESEGGFEETLGIPFSGDSGGSLLTVDTTETPLFSFRPKATFNSVVNRGQLVPLGFSAIVEDYPVMFRVKYAGTLTNPVWTSAGDDSIAEFDGQATALTGGQQIQALPVGASNQASGSDFLQIVSKLPISLDIDGNNDTILTLTAQCLQTNQSAKVAVSTFWRELY